MSLISKFAKRSVISLLIFVPHVLLLAMDSVVIVMRLSNFRMQRTLLLRLCKMSLLFVVCTFIRALWALDAFQKLTCCYFDQKRETSFNLSLQLGLSKVRSEMMQLLPT